MISDETVLSLDAKYYIDADIFALEQQTLLASTWQFAGHVSQLKKAGEYFCFTIAGEQLFSILDHEGCIKTFYNVCQHRAHELLNGKGQLNSKLLVCPYHAWSYNLDGALVTGPNLGVVADEARDKVCLNPVRTEIFHGFIFVNLDPNTEPMDSWFPGVREELAEFVPDIDRLAPMHWNEVPEACNWKVSIENYSECYHCEKCHPTFANGIVKADTYDIQAQGYCLRHTTECQNLDLMSYPIDPTSNARACEYSSWFLWPCFSFQVYPGNVLNTYHWVPNSVSEVTAWRGWFTEAGKASTTIQQLAQQDLDTTVAEDILLVESVFRGLNNRGYKPGPLVLDPAAGVRSEHSIRTLQQWMREGIQSSN